MDRKSLNLTASSNRVRPLLAGAGFEQKLGDEQFRFVRETTDGEFLLDLMVAPGASRDEPPILESDIETVAAPGLAYAISRGAENLRLTLVEDKTSKTSFDIPIVQLDAAFVMKATLVQKGIRIKVDRRVVDTADAIMLAAACLEDESCVDALIENQSRSDVKAALGWLEDAFKGTTSIGAGRVQAYFVEEFASGNGAEWSANVASELMERISP